MGVKKNTAQQDTKLKVQWQIRLCWGPGNDNLNNSLIISYLPFENHNVGKQEEGACNLQHC